MVGGWGSRRLCPVRWVTCNVRSMALVSKLARCFFAWVFSFRNSSWYCTDRRLWFRGFCYLLNSGISSNPSVGQADNCNTSRRLFSDAHGQNLRHARARELWWLSLSTMNCLKIFLHFCVKECCPLTRLRLYCLKWSQCRKDWFT